MSRKAVVAVSAVVALVAAGAALLIVGGGTATADEVRFQNVSEPGPVPFTAPTDVAAAGAESSSSSESSTTESTESTTPESTTPESSDPTAAGGGSEGQSGEEPAPGTFGGSGDNTVCDREKLIEELSADPEKLSAWAEVADVDADAEAVGEYIRGLTPSTLTEDTQVTNHSFVDGKANAYQAILEKGTAVLVDDDGNPVARCRCGNPLTEPLQLEAETKCYQCPANYTPPPPCEGRCYRAVKNPPPVTPGKPTTPTTPPPPTPATTADAIAAFKACSATKPAGSRISDCLDEYDAAQQACSTDALNPGCDATICLGRVSPFNSACGHYINEREAGIERACQNKVDAALEICLADERAKRLQCLDNPTESQCGINPNAKAILLREICTTVPTKLHCTTMQIGCAKTPNEPGCKELQAKCTADPNRIDCKEAAEFKQACAQTPEKPECKDAAKTAAPTLAPDEETTEEPGAEEGLDPGTDGTAPEGETGGGAPPDGGGGEAPAPEDAPAP